MPVVDQAVADRAAKLLHEAAPGATVILFGSHARGEAGPDSDLDFLVIEPKVAAWRREMVRLRDVLRPLRVPAEVLVESATSSTRTRSCPAACATKRRRGGGSCMDASETANVLLSKARDDAYALGRLVDDPAVSDTVLGFLGQQAVEKSLKAVLRARGRRLTGSVGR